jgi:hypothetical protein
MVPDRASRLLSLRRFTACISEPSTERSGKQADNDSTGAESSQNTTHAPHGS